MKKPDKWRNEARKSKKQIQVFLTPEEYEIVEKTKKDKENKNKYGNEVGSWMGDLQIGYVQVQ